MTEEKKDPRFLKRDELERELVMRDKQALITDCLKIFDTNTMLFEQIEAAKLHLIILKGENKKLESEADRLRQRKWWQFIFDRLAWKIEKMRERRKSFNYPMK